jgi:hypothetical protein
MPYIISDSITYGNGSKASHVSLIATDETMIFLSKSILPINIAQHRISRLYILIAQMAFPYASENYSDLLRTIYTIALPQFAPSR